MTTTAGIIVRTGPRPGDLGAVLAMHGELYARERGFDEEFEAHVAHGLAGFAAELAERGADAGRLWMAETGGEPVGTVALTDEGAGVAQLRGFLVTPAARGTGLGHRLLDDLLDHARQRGFQRVRLWTVSGLPAAAHLYAAAGFRDVERHPVRQWGHDLDELCYELELG